MAQDLKSKTVSGVLWSAIDRFSVQGVQFFIQIIMARLLLPSDYGMIGMLAVFIQLSQLFMDGGFSESLIQKQNRTQLDLSTVFYFNIVITILIYLGLYVSAPYIADFFHMPELTLVSRYIFLNLILISFSAIHKTILSIQVDFKTLTKISFMAAVLSGVVGVSMAYMGYGVWSLVAQTLVQGGCTTLLSLYFVRWKPTWEFSMKSFRTLFSFGSKLLLTRTIHIVYTNIYTLVIGRRYSATDLGFYTRADQFATFPSSNLNTIIYRVTFPILSSIQDDDERLCHAYRSYIRISSFIIFPLMIGFLTLAEPVIVLLLTDKWIDCVLLLQILCVDWMFDHLSIININLLLVKGHSDWSLKLEIVKKITAVTILLCSLPFGIVGMCCGRAIYSIIAAVMNTHYTERLIGLTLKRQILDVIPSLVLASVMGLVVYGSTFLIDSYILRIIVGVVIGAIFYLLTAWLTKMEEFKTLLDILKIKKHG